MSVVSVGLALRPRLISVLFLGDGIGFAIIALTSQANERIFREMIDLDGFKAVGEDFAENLAQILHRHAILRAARPGQAWLDGAQVKFEQIVKLWLRGVIGAEESLRLRITLHKVYQPGIAAR